MNKKTLKEIKFFLIVGLREEPLVMERMI